MADNCSIGKLKSNSYHVKPDINLLSMSDVLLNTLHLIIKKQGKVYGRLVVVEAVKIRGQLYLGLSF